MLTLFFFVAVEFQFSFYLIKKPHTDKFKRMKKYNPSAQMWQKYTINSVQIIMFLLEFSLWMHTPEN